MRVDACVVVDAIVRTTVKAVARAVVAVLADSVVVVERHGKGRKRIERRLEVVDAAAVIIEDRVAQQTKPLVRPKALSGGPAERVGAATVHDIGVATVAIQTDRRLLTGFLGAQVDRSADTVAIHIRRERLVHLDGIHHVGRDHIQANLPHRRLGRRDRDAIHGDVGQARLRAAHLNVNALAFDPVERNGWESSDCVAHVRIGQAGDDLGRKHLQ